MRRFFTTSIFILLVSTLFACSTSKEKRKPSWKVVFPLIETPATFTSSIDDKDYLIFIEHSDSLYVTGHYMALGKTMTDTLPFQLEARGRNARLYYNGKKETFRPRVKSMDERHADGYARLSVLGTAFFHIQIHETPVFRDVENKRYQDTLFAVEETSDICYANVPGFWSALGDETDVTDKIFRMTEAISETPLDLHLDIFRPQNDTLEKHPLVMLVHGGAFYFGSKDDKSITRWCQHLASLGYVTASIDYRIGFLPSMGSIGRAGYRAVQDAHAAMRFLVSHQEEYGIDTCGNAIKADFRIKGIIDMWGAMPDTTLLHGHNIPILAFHGDADNIVPYGHDYPFSIAGPLKTLLVEPMFGSSCIVDRATKLGYDAQLVTFVGYKHSPHVNPETKALNNIFYVIQDKMSVFFHEIVSPEKLTIIEDNNTYRVSPEPLSASWKAEGGVILSSDNNSVNVAWIRNAPQHSITVSAAMPYGIGLTETRSY